MINFDFRFMSIEEKEKSFKSISDIVNKNPRKICFSSCHKTSLKRKENGNQIGTFSVPYSDTIKPVFEAATNLVLHQSRFGNYWHSINSEKEYSTIDAFFNEYSQIVFIRDCLELSIALSENFSDDNRTRIGMLEYEAKYCGNKNAEKEIVDICAEWLKKLPYYKNADYICAIPPSKNGADNLPRLIARGLTGFQFQNISENVLWAKDKEELKEMEISKKLNYLENTGLEIGVDLKGKVVILLDDLYQSGITMQYVAMKMKESGASKIFGLSIVKSRKNTDNL